MAPDFIGGIPAEEWDMDDSTIDWTNWQQAQTLNLSKQIAVLPKPPQGWHYEMVCDKQAWNEAKCVQIFA